MWQVSLLLLVLCGSAMGDIQDATRVAGSAGPQVVEAVISLIRESCVFPNDRLMLRRFAYMLTNDGQEVASYMTNMDGGIWAIAQADFLKTQNDPNLAAYYQDIANRFGISWNTVQYGDLSKPLLSGLSAALLLVQTFGNNVPKGLERQAAWYQKTIYPNDPMAAYNFTKQADRILSGCEKSNLDLAFMVDSSSSLNPVDFGDALDFAANVLDGFTVDPSSVQVSFLTFSTGFKTVFAFNDYSTKSDVQAAIRAAQYIPGDTDTDQALGYAATSLFLPGGPSGARVTSAKVAVIVTDGKATRSSEVIQRAQQLRDTGVTVFVIGVGDQVDNNELNGLATDPDCTHVQLLTDYQDLDALRSEIQRLSCRAPVILKEGTYTFPCQSTNNYRIGINGNETITIRPQNGFVDIYGSFLNPYPNSAFNEFKTRATSAREAIIYVKDESRPLYLSVVSQGTDPVFCQAGNNYEIIVQNKNAIQPDALLTCYTNGLVHECTALDILTAIYRVVQPATLGFPNPCQVGHPGYYPHPLAYDRFIYCDISGTAYLVFCPANYWYMDSARGCVPGTPPPVTAAVTTPRPVVTFPPQTTASLPAITSAPGSNPCTEGALKRGDRFFPYPGNDLKYIACTEWPNYGVIKDCAPYHKWSQPDLACIYYNTVVDPTKNLYVSTPAPITVDCSVGLTDNDLFYHPYPGDNTKFIQCDQFGDAFIMDCPTGRIWNQHFLTCLPNAMLPTGNVPIGK